MNCMDVSRLLDDGEIAALSATEQADFRTHLAQCGDCAGQNLASERLRSFRTAVPPLPAALYERAEQLEALRSSTAGERGSRRPLLIGSLFLLGAAGLFATAPWSDTSAAPQ